jgi:hypothetical protein
MDLCLGVPCPPPQGLNREKQEEEEEEEERWAGGQCELVLSGLDRTLYMHAFTLISMCIDGSLF